MQLTTLIVQKNENKQKNENLKVSKDVKKGKKKKFNKEQPGSFKVKDIDEMLQSELLDGE